MTCYRSVWFGIDWYEKFCSFVPYTSSKSSFNPLHYPLTRIYIFAILIGYSYQIDFAILLKFDVFYCFVHWCLLSSSSCIFIAVPLLSYLTMWFLNDLDFILCIIFVSFTFQFLFCVVVLAAANIKPDLFLPSWHALFAVLDRVLLFLCILGGFVFSGRDDVVYNVFM